MQLLDTEQKNILQDYLQQQTTTHYQEYLRAYTQDFHLFISRCFDDPDTTVFFNKSQGGFAIMAFTDSPWDSRILGIPTAKLMIISSSTPSDERQLLDEVIAFAKEKQVELIKCRIRSNCISPIKIMAEAGFKKVDCMNIYFWDKQHDRIPKTAEPTASATIKKGFTPQEIPVIQDLAKTAFTHSWINNDKSFSPAQVESFYQNYFTSLKQRQDLIQLSAQMKGKTIAFTIGESDQGLTPYLPDKLGYLSLIAVHQACRRQGIARSMLAGFLAETAKQLRFIEVGTQENNIPANRLYQAMGMKQVSSLITLHLCL